MLSINNMAMMSFGVWVSAAMARLAVTSIISFTL